MRPSYSLSNIFQDAARSKVTHKKNLLSLRKQTSQETFQIDFLQAVCRVLPVKKGNSDAENVLKFVKSYFELLESSESTQGVLCYACMERAR